MACVTMTVELNMITNHVNRHKYLDWPNGIAWRLLAELRKWAQTSDLRAMLELRAEFHKVHVERKDNPEVTSSILSAINNKYDNSGLSVDD